MLMEILDSLRKADSLAALTDDKLAIIREGINRLAPTTRSKIEDIVEGLGSKFATWLIQLALTGGTGSFA